MKYPGATLLGSIKPLIGDIEDIIRIERILIKTNKDLPIKEAIYSIDIIKDSCIHFTWTYRVIDWQLSRLTKKTP